jgi:hypothetical protein
MIRESAVTFLFHLIFHTFSFTLFSFHLCLFLLFLIAINLMMCVFVRNFAVSLWQMCSCLSLGDALAFFTPWYFLAPYNLFLYYTLWTMCDSSLGVWKHNLSVCLFIFICLFYYSKKIIKNKIVRCCWLSMITSQLWFAYHWFV